MKSIQFFFLSVLVPVFGLAQETSSTLDARINENFKNATSWFTDVMFAEIPIIGEVGIP